MSTLSQWRLAARLARRETLRRPGRTVLVALLIAVPVAGMVAGNVLSRTSDREWPQEFALRAGGGDILVDVDSTVDDLDARLASLLPPGSAWETEVGVWGTNIRSSTHSVTVRFLEADLVGPLRKRVIDVTSGRAPRSVDEIALDRRSADLFGVGPGERLELEHPRGTWAVTGIVRSASSFGEPLAVVADFDWSRSSRGYEYASTTIDVPADASITSATDALTASFGPGRVQPRLLAPSQEALRVVDPLTADIAWGWVFGTTALAVLGVIIAAAFATSARRQLVALGQLAANGADRRLLQLTLALQGSWSGIVGVLAGAALAAGALAAGRSLAEFAFGSRLPAYQVAASDLGMIAAIGIAAATVAALVPARGIARVPIMSALGGRRPLGRVPRRMVGIGLVLLAAGLLLLGLAASAVAASDGGNSDLWAAISVLGGLLVLAAVVCTAPLAVDLLGRACARLPGAWRLSGRSLARTRARAAGVVAALGAMTALVVAGTTMWATATLDESSGEWMPPNAVYVFSCVDLSEQALTDLIDPPMVTCSPPSADDLAQVSAVVDEADRHTRRSVSWDAAPFSADGGTFPADVLTDGELVVADPWLIDLVGLNDADRELLDTTGAIRIVGRFSELEYPTEMAIEVEDGPRLTLDIASTTGPAGSYSQASTNGLLITPARAESLGLPIVETGTMFVLPAPLTGDQSAQLEALNSSTYGNDIFDIASSPPDAPTSRFAGAAFESPPDSGHVLVEVLVALVATLLTLVVVAIGLALSAIESRDERDVLAAIGAPPSVLRKVAARKALLMSATAAVIALPAGLLPVIVVRFASDRRGATALVEMPWLTLALLVVAVPAVASACTDAASAIAQRVRPTTMSTLRAD